MQSNDPKIFTGYARPSLDRDHKEEPKPGKIATFSFHVRDGSTEEGLPGALFEFINYQKTGRHMARSNRHGKVYFSMIIGETYVLLEKSPPYGYKATPEIYSVCLKDGSLFVNGKKTSSFVVFNHYQHSRFSVVYHEDEESLKSYRLKLSYGATHTIINEKQARLQKEGYAFFAWKQLPCGKSDVYLPGDTLRIDDDVHLYGQWVPLPSSNQENSRMPMEV